MTTHDVRSLSLRSLTLVAATACVSLVTAQQPAPPAAAAAARQAEINKSVAVSWLNWQLRGDAQSAKRFVGEDCGLCKDTRWSLERKQFPGAGASK